MPGSTDVHPELIPVALLLLLLLGALSFLNWPGCALCGFSRFGADATGFSGFTIRQKESPRRRSVEFAWSSP